MKNFACWFGASVLASLGTGLSAEETAFCDRLDQAMAATANQDAQADMVKTVLDGFGASPANCGFSLDLSGSRSANCHWAFSFRSDEVNREFTELLARLTACADPAFGIQADRPVNHPDFFDLRILRVSGGDVGLSLKDKSGLQQTYIFLRLTPLG